MKQLLQNFNNGAIELEETPLPRVKKGHLRIKSTVSLISVGTEKMLVDFGKSNLLQKAKSQPEKVKQVLDKIKTDGLLTTYKAVKSKLDSPIPMGYSNVGIVDAVGEGVTEFKIGDRVVSNGCHAEYVIVPKNLCAKIPDSVTDEEASFTIVSAITLQGIRLLKPEIGQTIVVSGLGLLGLLGVKLLQANGCTVIGLDPNAEKRQIAESYGVKTLDPTDQHVIDTIHQLTDHNGADGVLITASTPSSTPLSQAAQACRKRGKVVLVGVLGNEWNRSEFYEKEISFQVSCSYGPGRYDSKYEIDGIDYPIGFVQWTQNRNFQAILKLMAQKRLSVSDMLTSNYDFNSAQDAYEAILKDPNQIGVLLNYNATTKTETTIQLTEKIAVTPQSPVIGLIGSGIYTQATLSPILKSLSKNKKIRLHTIASSAGLSSTKLGKKLGFEYSTTDTEALFKNPEINTVIVTTQSNTHAKFILEALKHNKHVFVEKPLCITHEELEKIKAEHKNRPNLIISVGFNRRYSSHIQKIKSILSPDTPVTINMLINAGALPETHWHHDINNGGLRIVQEGVHFIDLANHLVGEYSSKFSISSTQNLSINNDKFSLTLTYPNGSLVTIHYWANGNKQFPKERITIFNQETVVEIDNFRKTTGYGTKGFSKHKTSSQDKGHQMQFELFIKAITGEKAPLMSIDDIFNATQLSLDARQLLIENYES
jgi:predicted dehydrogenase/threonine dehydrogenase-like Zn-dependent dehydrogenase